MKPNDLWDAVVRALAVELKVSEDQVVRARSLKAEMKMDSIAAVNVAFMLEEELGVEIEILEGDQFDSLDQVMAVVQRAVGR